MIKRVKLKTTEFDPRDLGQLEFYLEALDQTERRSNENPSIGILMCKDANPEVVRYALNRSMSPTMISQYEDQLPSPPLPVSGSARRPAGRACSPGWCSACTRSLGAMAMSALPSPSQPPTNSATRKSAMTRSM